MSSSDKREQTESLEEQLARLQHENARLQHEFAQFRHKSRKTNLLEYLDACHVNLSTSIKVRPASTATQGNPSNAKNKLRPNKIRAWKNFPEHQASVWRRIMDMDFCGERYFRSLQFVAELGETVRMSTLGSEVALHDFEKRTVLDHVTLIVQKLYDNANSREALQLKGTVTYEDHGNMLNSQDASGQRLLGMDEQTSYSAPQQSNNRQTRASTMISGRASTSSAAVVASESTSGAKPSDRPPADQFCVYSTSEDASGTQSCVAALVVESKAPHKLQLAFINEGLQDMDLDEVVVARDPESMEDSCRRLIAAVITQTFSYMVRAGLEYGYACTGEAFIFLRIPEDPTTVEYYLSVPNAVVGPTTGWNPNSDGPNRLHATAVGEVLAFTLGALRKPPRDARWQKKATACLKRWEVSYEDLYVAMPKVDPPSSPYVPSRNTKEWVRSSPVRLRSGRLVGGIRPCRSPSSSFHSTNDDDEDDDDFNPDTPSRPPPRSAPAPAASSSSSRTGKKEVSKSGTIWDNSRTERRERSYCTPQCLLGLLTQGALDKDCPNRQDHGLERHAINRATFVRLLRKQLAHNLDYDVVNLGVWGSRGAMFQITLTSHGYTVAAKGTTRALVPYLEHEEKVYGRLRPIQGIHVPVCLGHITLKESLPYQGIVELEHMMLMSFGGWPIYKCGMEAEKESRFIQAATSSMQAVHRLGVLHRDACVRNLLWNAETQRVTVIDFERAEIPRPMARPALIEISPNRKRKWEMASTAPGTDSRRAQYGNEISAMEGELGRYFAAI